MKIRGKTRNLKNARSRPPLDKTPVGAKMIRPQNTNTNNGLVKMKQKNAKIVRTRGSRVRPKFSDSSSSKSDSSDDSKYKNKGCNKKKKHRKRTKQDSSESLSSNSDSYDESNYKSKRCDKMKNYGKNNLDPIKICAKLTA